MPELRSCHCYTRHEFECLHLLAADRDRPEFARWRWLASDGCSGEVCWRCVTEHVLGWPDLTSLLVLDSHGIPYSPSSWTPEDHAGDLLRCVGGEGSA